LSERSEEKIQRVIVFAIRSFGFAQDDGLKV